MPKETTIEKTLPLAYTENGMISITRIREPYGKGSGMVASIGISLDGDADNPEWKVHIPLENLEAVIEALVALK